MNYMPKHMRTYLAVREALDAGTDVKINKQGKRHLNRIEREGDTSKLRAGLIAFRRDVR